MQLLVIKHEDKHTQWFQIHQHNCMRYFKIWLIENQCFFNRNIWMAHALTQIKNPGWQILGSKLYFELDFITVRIKQRPWVTVSTRARRLKPTHRSLTADVSPVRTAGFSMASDFQYRFVISTRLFPVIHAPSMLFHLTLIILGHMVPQQWWRGNRPNGRTRKMKRKYNL